MVLKFGARSYFTTREISKVKFSGSCYKRQKAQAPTPQAPIRNCPNEKSRKRQSS